MASTTTGNAVPLALVHRTRCGSGGGAEAGHASLRAFAAAHAAFDTLSQLGGDSASRQRAIAIEPTPGSPVFVFGSKSASGDVVGFADASAADCPLLGARAPHVCCEEAGESPSSRFANAPHAPAAADEEGAPRLRPATEPTVLVFGPNAPRERKRGPALAPIAPKRAREVPAVDDVVTLLARCVASDDLSDVDRAAELLAGCRVPGKRPRTASSCSAGAAREPKLRSADVDEVDAKGAVGSAGDSGASDDRSTNSEPSCSPSSARSRPSNDASIGNDVEKHDDDELSFLVTRCDIDSGNRTELFMPYIS